MDNGPMHIDFLPGTWVARLEKDGETEKYTLLQITGGIADSHGRWHYTATDGNDRDVVYYVYADEVTELSTE